MNIFDRLQRGEAEGTISPEQRSALDGLARGVPFSIHLELNALLYAGVLTFIAGLAWTIGSWSQRVGDFAVLVALSLSVIGGLWYCFTRESPPRALIFDYLLYLASLLWSVEWAFIETKYRLARGQWDYYLLASAGLYFFLAYRFDNRFVLSLALSTLAGWFGITVSRWPSHENAEYRMYAIAYGLFVIACGALLRKRDLRPHFLGTYLHVAANVLFWASLWGVFENRRSPSWLSFLLVTCAASFTWGLAKREFLFVVYASLYGYVGITAVLVPLMFGPGAVTLYFSATSILMVVGLIGIAHRFGSDQ